MVLESIGVGDTVWQILGTAGFLETIFELVYVSTQASIFTKFEKFFFIYTASWELLGELVALFGLFRMFAKVLKGPFEFETIRKLDIAKTLLRDPVHNLAHPVDLTRKDGEGPRPPSTLVKLFWGDLTLDSYITFAMYGVALPAFSVVVWAVFLPMWGMFDGDDYDLRLWICISFWICITAVFVFSFICEEGDPRILLFVSTTYALNKAVEVYLLFSRGERLADGFVGQGLRYLQIAELSSVAIIVYRTLFTDVYSLSLFF